MRFLLVPLACLRAFSSRFHFSRLTVALASVVLASLPLADRARAAVFDWNNPAGDYFDIGSNWLGGAPPSNHMDDVVYFRLNNNSYEVLWDSITASTTTGARKLTVENGQVTFRSLDGSLQQWEYSLDNFPPSPNLANALIVDGGFAGSSLTIRGLHLKNYGGAQLLTNGTLTVDGNHPRGSKLSILSSHGIDFMGGTLNVLAGGVVANTVAYLGGNSQNGAATVDGAGSQWNNSAELYVGHQGSGFGYVGVEAGGQVTNTVGYMGFNSGSSGQAVVRGSGSRWNNSAGLYVGYSGFGTLAVLAGGQVSNSVGFIGRNAGSTGAVTVTGSGSQWNMPNFLIVGHSGNATLNVEAGGVVNSGSVGSVANAIGHTPGSTGAVTVTGSGSQWNTEGHIFVGGGEISPGGTGTLTIADNGFVSVAGSTTYLYSSGTLNINGGVLETGSFNNSQHGVLNLNNGKLTVNGAGGTFSPGTTSYTINGNTAAALPTLAITNTASFTLADSLLVGQTNKGNLTVSAASVVSNLHGFLGVQAGSTGTATVNGANSQWNNTGQMQVAIAGNATLTVEAGGKVTNTDGYVGIQSGSTGAVTVTGAGSQWNNSGSLHIGPVGSGRLNVANGGMVTVGGALNVGASGVLVGNGSIVGNVSSGGAVAPGNSAGLLTIEGNYSQTSGGTLYMEIGGTTSGSSYDQLLATGQMALGGTLNVSLLNGFEPQSGNSFNILDWGSIAGTFATLALPPLSGSLTWNTSQLYNTGVLSVVGPGVAGDYNTNGVVDAADYVVWRKNPGGFPADAYATWRSHFGQPPGSGSGANVNAAVPEPATMVLLIFAAVFVCVAPQANRKRA